MRRGCYSPAALRAGRCQRHETPGWCRPPQGGERQPEAESGGNRSNPTRPAGDRTRRLHERFPALRTRAGGSGLTPTAANIFPVDDQALARWHRFRTRCVVPCPGDEFFKDLSHGRRAGHPAHPRPRRHAATAGPLIVTIIFNPPVFFGSRRPGDRSHRSPPPNGITHPAAAWGFSPLAGGASGPSRPLLPESCRPTGSTRPPPGSRG